jgi:hypothetical protein
MSGPKLLGWKFCYKLLGAGAGAVAGFGASADFHGRVKLAAIDVQLFAGVAAASLDPIVSHRGFPPFCPFP